MNPFVALLFRLAHQVIRLSRCDQLEALQRLLLDQLAPTVEVDDALEGSLVGLVVFELCVLQHKPPAIPVAQSDIHLLQVARFLRGSLCGLKRGNTVKALLLYISWLVVENTLCSPFNVTLEDCSISL